MTQFWPKSGQHFKLWLFEQPLPPLRLSLVHKQKAIWPLAIINDEN